MYIVHTFVVTESLGFSSKVKYYKISNVQTNMSNTEQTKKNKTTCNYTMLSKYDYNTFIFKYNHYINVKFATQYNNSLLL